MAHGVGSGEADFGLDGLIPRFTDQNWQAHSRRPSDMILQGWSTSLFQAPQQWSTISS